MDARSYSPEGGCPVSDQKVSSFNMNQLQALLNSHISYGIIKHSRAACWFRQDVHCGLSSTEAGKHDQRTIANLDILEIYCHIKVHVNPECHNQGQTARLTVKPQELSFLHLNTSGRGLERV